MKKKIINTTNILMLSCSILASYCVVTFSGAPQNWYARKSKLENIERSALRIAQSFEQYNQKRFTP